MRFHRIDESVTLMARFCGADQFADSMSVQKITLIVTNLRPTFVKRGGIEQLTQTVDDPIVGFNVSAVLR